MPGLTFFNKPYRPLMFGHCSKVDNVIRRKIYYILI